MSDAGSGMSGLDRNVVDFRNVGRDMKNHKTDNSQPAFIRFCFGDKAGYKTVVIQQAIVTIDGPMRQMLPGPLDVDDPIHVTFAGFTNSDFQGFHEQSPRRACARIPVKESHCWESWPIPQLFRRGINPLCGFSIPELLAASGNEPLRRRKRSTVAEIKMRPTRRALARQAIV